MPTNNPTQTTPQAPPSSSSTAFGSQRVQERVEETAQSASDAAIEKVREVRERAETSIDEQRGQFADRVRRLGDVLQSSSSELGRKDAFAQQLLEQASTRVQRAANYIETASASDVVDDLHSVARQRPGLFFGGAFLVGLAVGRFAKSSRGTGGEHHEARLSDSVRSSAQRAAAHDVSSNVSGRGYQPPPTSSTAGSAAGVKYGSPAASEPPKPQHETPPSEAARAVLPGEGSKS